MGTTVDTDFKSIYAFQKNWRFSTIRMTLLEPDD